ncbi:MAG: prolipoprotein diacylglyceryl transferase [Synergistaceae bacterium]|jgi:phosphatidylglycerol:prolipoprotein diacylglycerol transferase|nr:prolipoprotein diacylglyceryl transferase [Synergistaceae bacterium]
MYPVLFRISGIPVETYYVLWFSALSVALAWMIRRLAIYEIDDDQGRRVISWSFMGMLLGARAFEYIWNFSTYWNDPSLILDLNRGGLAEVGALSGAVLTALVLCRCTGVSFNHLCEAGSPPALLAMTLGRWGCFFAGCCVGIQSASPLALHFPYDALSVTRHPTQIYYSLSAGAILLSLLAIERGILKEREILKKGKLWTHALITPLGLLLYSIMRLSIDSLRLETGSGGLSFSHGALIAAMPLEVLWLATSWRAFRKTREVQEQQL